MDFTNTQAYTIGDVAGDDVSFSSLTEIISTSVGTTMYVYVVNTDNTNHCKLRDGAGNMWGLVEPGEWAFFAIPASTGLKFEPQAGTIVVNYVTMAKA
jgi:hypothetical protein